MNQYPGYEYKSSSPSLEPFPASSTTPTCCALPIAAQGLAGGVTVVVVGVALAAQGFGAVLVLDTVLSLEAGAEEGTPAHGFAGGFGELVIEALSSVSLCWIDNSKAAAICLSSCKLVKRLSWTNKSTD
jgi:hypothetical protein